MLIALADLASHTGTEVGRSQWHAVTQAQVQAFADATGDQQWLHVDAARAAAGPFGGTIAHGYLTLALTPLVLSEAVQLDGVALTLNYGIDRVRFMAPMPVGSRLRAIVELLRAEPFEGGLQAAWKLTFEIEGAAKPACVAEIVFRYIAA